MKKWIALCVIVLIVGLSQAALAAPNLVGRWVGEASFVAHSSPYVAPRVFTTTMEINITLQNGVNGPRLAGEVRPGLFPHDLFLASGHVGSLGAIQLAASRMAVGTEGAYVMHLNAQHYAALLPARRTRELRGYLTGFQVKELAGIGISGGEVFTATFRLLYTPVAPASE